MGCPQTHDAALDAQIEAVRRLGAAGRVRMAAQMSEDARRIAIEGELRRHPELTEREARLAVLRQSWGLELARRIASALHVAR